MIQTEWATKLTPVGTVQLHAYDESHVYTHIRSVQEANVCLTRAAIYMLADNTFDKQAVSKDVIAHILTLDDRDKQLQMIDDPRLWMRVVGTRGYVGKKTGQCKHTV